MTAVDDRGQRTIDWLIRNDRRTGPRVVLACRHGHDLAPIRLDYEPGRGLWIWVETNDDGDDSRPVLEDRRSNLKTDIEGVNGFLFLEHQDNQVWRCQQPGCDAKRIEVSRRAVVSAYMGAATKGNGSIASQFEMRELANGPGGTTLRFSGYASIVESAYSINDVFGPYSETIARNAFNRTLKDGANVVFLAQREGIAMARTKAGTQKLSAEPLAERESGPTRGRRAGPNSWGTASRFSPRRPQHVNDGRR